MRGPQIRVMKSFHRSPFNVFIEIDDPKQQYYCLAEPLVMKEVKEPFQPMTPTCTLELTAAQQLIDDLWACGIRPSEGSGSAGQLAAVQKHLEDMRKLVSKTPLVGK